MKVSVLLSLITLVTSKNVLKIDFDLHRGDDKKQMQLGGKPYFKRDSFTMQLTNEKTFYVTDLEIGSNGDKVKVLVDTGSSDLWIPSNDVECYAPSYYKRDSKTSKRDRMHVGDVLVDAISGKSGDETLLKNIHVKADGDEEEDESSSTGTETSEFVFASVAPGQGINTRNSSRRSTSIRASATADSASASETNACITYGSFATGESDTFKKNDSAPAFTIEYADGTGATGIWGTDNVKVSNTTVSGLSFAVVNETSSDVAVLGIGLAGMEMTYDPTNGRRSRYQYENLPLKLRSEGIIQRAAYSLYLGSNDAETGTILFGAVDHAKYEGTLKSVPIVNTLEDYGYVDAARLEINIDSVNLKNSSGEVAVNYYKYPALLDTGSTLSYFPSAVLSKLADQLALRYNSYYGAYLIDCDYDNEGSIDFDFSGVKINAPLNDFVYETNTTSSCFFGILPGYSTYFLLGDNFLRNAYVVYDLDDLTISLAQVKHTDEEDIEIIESSIPKADSISTAETEAFTGYVTNTNYETTYADYYYSGTRNYGSSSRTSGSRSTSAGGGASSPRILFDGGYRPFNTVGILVLSFLLGLLLSL
ncbi:aspartic proteinase 3 [[Candida] jaroonii]|uniref:Aspartic proteinase 3 n=1 Tax=[Candida] jaroonii TaxID=467808 RepID=A0ACA9YBZ5_9ASCO|nr:aspartic proteinase 3 [[Candida] jaroonii]